MDGLGFLNVGFGELFFILIFAGLILGPHRVRTVALLVGKWTAKARNLSRDFMGQLNSELEQEEKEALRSAVQDLQSLRAEVEQLKAEMRKGATSFITEGKSALSEAQKELGDAKAELEQLRSTHNLTPTEIQEAQATIDATEEPENKIGGFDLPNLVSVKDDPV